MHDVQYYKSIFDKYGGMMRTTQLAEEKIFYPQREKLIADGYVEKIRRGYYQWINPDDFSEAGTMGGHAIRIYDKERLICDCLRYRNKMDKEIFNKAIQKYIADPEKSIPKLMEYAGPLRVKKLAKDLIGVWL